MSDITDVLQKITNKFNGHFRDKSRVKITVHIKKNTRIFRHLPEYVDISTTITKERIVDSHIFTKYAGYVSNSFLFGFNINFGQYRLAFTYKNNYSVSMKYYLWEII